MSGLIDVLMIGTGEYTTGYGTNTSKTDKGAGVVGLTVFDLKRRGFVGRVALAGTNGSKFPAIRTHLKSAIENVYHASKLDTTVSTFPTDTAVDPKAYLAALDTLPKGSAVTIFTPDDTHFEIALDCVQRGMHVLVTKPVVMTLDQHIKLAKAATAHKVLVAVEVHKRWDPLYTDARDRLRKLGSMSFFTAYMSQPKIQLETFRAWAGVSSDISYYLNSHHIDYCEWVFGDRMRPVQVTAMASTGVADEMLGRSCEDSITLTVKWESLPSTSKTGPAKHLGVATFTASWIAPKSDVHSQQRLFAMCHSGEVTIDQAHRGYSVATDASGYASANPLFMKYTPDEGRFVGQLGYGYRSIEAFIQACRDIQAGRTTVEESEKGLASIHHTYQTTAILEAGRRSLDAGGAPVYINYDADDSTQPVGFA